MSLRVMTMWLVLCSSRGYPRGGGILVRHTAALTMSSSSSSSGRSSSGRTLGRGSGAGGGRGPSRGGGGRGPARGGGGGRGRSSSPSPSGSSVDAGDGVRLNKCLPSLSRRGADDAIAEGRVTVNGQPPTAGHKVQPGDVVRLDGKLQHWQGAAAAKQQRPAAVLEDRDFVYLKFWKGRGVTCTSDRQDRTNIIQAGRFDLFPQRVFTVGRLDKDSTGLILLTSDGRVNQAMLSPATKKEKIYTVEFDKAPTDVQLEKLRTGVLITTEAQGQHKASRPLTAKTRPCTVTKLGGGDAAGRTVEFTLMEGRNRQIRKMAEVVGLAVVRLHRTSFAGIGLKGLTEGNWCELSEKEMEVIQQAVQTSLGGGGVGGGGQSGGEDDEED